MVVPKDYLNLLLNKDSKPETKSIIVKKSRIVVTDSFALPSNSFHDSTSLSLRPRRTSKGNNSSISVKVPESLVNNKRTSKGNISLIQGKVPELPVNYLEFLESCKYETKGRKQADQPFGELNIKAYDLYSLRNRQYVNDIIIDHYLQLVCKRSLETPEYRKTFALATFFNTMLNNGQSVEKLISWIKADLFEFELIFLPINQENHWFLFVADLVNRNFFIYDSLFDNDYKEELEKIVDFLKAYATSKGKEIDWKEWSDVPTSDQLGPTQKNGVDCGVFLCQYAEHLSRNAPLDFAQCGMANYRKRMLYELMTGALLDPSL